MKDRSDDPSHHVPRSYKIIIIINLLIEGCIIWVGNGIYVSISKHGSDTPVTRPETDKAGLSSRDRNVYYIYLVLFITNLTVYLCRLVVNLNHLCNMLECQSIYLRASHLSQRKLLNGKLRWRPGFQV